MKPLITSVILILSTTLFGQNKTIYLEPVTINNFGGFQSFAFGTDNSKVLIIGGRLDGLHRRQPWASFDAAGHNNQLFVIDLNTGLLYSSGLTSLPTRLQNQMKSTNMEFIQEGNTLYAFGGYGLDANANHVTFDNLTAIDVPGLIQAIINNQSIGSYFRQYTYPEFKVTGGQIYTIHYQYYLVGGQLFDGVYNPVGPTHGPGFTQAYTNEARRFSITDDGTNLSVQFDTPYQDANLLHKRDYNAVPTYHNGKQAILALSGVFQHNVDLPWTNAVLIDSTSFTEVQNFTQYYNHYHSAKASIYDPGTNKMSYYIFGGIAQYYLLNGSQVQDNDVPFVKTISRLDHLANGTLTETPLTIEMPDYLGAGAEFVPTPSLSTLPNEIIDASHFSGDSVLIGHIIGGIKSSDKNIFFINTGVESETSPVIYKVYLVNTSIGIQEEGLPSSHISPNPSKGVIDLEVKHEQQLEKIVILDVTGRIVTTVESLTLESDGNRVTLDLSSLPKSTYLIQLHFLKGEMETQSLILE